MTGPIIVGMVLVFIAGFLAGYAKASYDAVNYLRKCRAEQNKFNERLLAAYRELHEEDRA